MSEILKIAKKNKLLVLEDCATALGARINKKHVGNFGNAGVFSFYPIKHITTGEGGAILTNKKELDKFCREYHDHGHENNKKLPRGMDTVSTQGFNYRITEIQDIVANKTKTIVFPNMYHFLRKLATGRLAYTKYLKYLLPKKNRSDVKYLISFIIKKWIKKDLQYKELDNHHRKYLTDLYNDDVKKLKINLNYEFSEWKDFN